VTKSQSSHESELTALLEEYRALYDLAVFRMTALDRRVPVTAGAFGVAIASLGNLPADSQLMVFFATPLLLIWLMRTTVNHARSLEDVLRRIELIEQSANRVIGKKLLGFQSLHPSRGRHVGGRTGHESVRAVLASIYLLIGAAFYQFHASMLLPKSGEVIYVSLLVVVAALTLRENVQLSKYRYNLS
jgi:hypothetical protein